MTTWKILFVKAWTHNLNGNGSISGHTAPSTSPALFANSTHFILFATMYLVTMLFAALMNNSPCIITE